MIQFGTIKFRRIFKNFSYQFVWIEKNHYNSRVSPHEAPTKEGTGYQRFRVRQTSEGEIKNTETLHFMWCIKNFR